MATEREIQETVARCVAGLVFYVNSGKTPKTKAMMVAEARAVAALVAGWGLSDDRILRPVEAELVARYGPETRAGLHAEFVKAFKGKAGPGPLTSMARA